MQNWRGAVNFEAQWMVPSPRLCLAVHGYSAFRHPVMRSWGVTGHPGESDLWALSVWISRHSVGGIQNPCDKRGWGERLSFVDTLRGSSAVQTSSGVGMVSAEKAPGGSVGASVEHIHSKDCWRCTGSSGIGCLPSPWCWRDRLNLRTQTLEGSLEVQSLNEWGHVKEVCGQCWRRVWGCGSPRSPCLCDPHSYHVPSRLKTEGGGTQNPQVEAMCFVFCGPASGHLLQGARGREAAQPSGEGGLVGKAKACSQGANCIYSWIHMNFKMLLGICT